MPHTFLLRSTSLLLATFEPSHTYFIVVGGLGGSKGQFTLSITQLTEQQSD